MIITRTPYRVSFLGGGSDLPAFYRQSQGEVISTSIDRYMYITIHPCFNPNEIRLKYSEYESVLDVEDLRHPIVKTALKKHNLTGVEITSIGDIPAQTGLGSSSAFTVGLLKAIYAYQGIDISNEQIAIEACEIEIDLLKSPIGKQDQYASAIGGLNHFTFKSDGGVDIQSLHMSESTKRAFADNSILFFTGKSRNASEILKDQSENMETNDRAFELQKRIVQIVPRMLDDLRDGVIDHIGEYLNEAWSYKKELAQSISSTTVDEIYQKALDAGAKGGKLLGAGGGGFLLFYCPVEKQNALIEALNLRHMKVKFDNTGSQIVYSSKD